MLRAQAIIKKVKDKLLLGSSNNSPDLNQPNYLDNLMVFMRAIVAHIESSPVIKNYFHQNKNKKMNFLFKAALRTLLAEVYQCGNCGEQARMVLMTYLKTGLNMPLELITIYGENKAKKPAGHSLVIVNRNDAKLNDPRQWENFISNDPWRKDNEPTFFFKGEKSTFKVLVGDYLQEPKAIKLHTRITENLTAEEWKQLADFLGLVKAILNENIINQFLKTYKLPLNAAEELIDIRAALNAEIIVFIKLSIKPPVPPEISKHFNAEPKKLSQQQ